MIQQSDLMKCLHKFRNAANQLLISARRIYALLVWIIFVVNAHSQTISTAELGIPTDGQRL